MRAMCAKSLVQHILQELHLLRAYKMTVRLQIKRYIFSDCTNLISLQSKLKTRQLPERIMPFLKWLGKIPNLCRFFIKLEPRSFYSFSISPQLGPASADTVRGT